MEDLLQRTADGVLAEDRREALADLRDLLSDNVQACLVSKLHVTICQQTSMTICDLQAQLAVGSQGLLML